MFFGVLLAAVFVPNAAKAADYVMLPAHLAVVFKIKHLGISWTYGRFNKAKGHFSFDPENVDKASFNLYVDPASVDTLEKKRDAHLRSADFFNVKEFPVMKFESTSVNKGKNGLVVKGNFTMHGVTRKIQFNLNGGKTAMFKGKNLRGFSTEFMLRRSEYGMKGFLSGVGDEVYIGISFEGLMKD